MNTQEALKMAIEAMKIWNGKNVKTNTASFRIDFEGAIQTCKEALAQPAQEPVDYEGSGLAAKIMDCDVLGNPIITMLKQCPIGTKLYLKPAPSWQGLSDDEIDSEALKDDHAAYFALGALWANKKLKEKNHG